MSCPSEGHLGGGPITHMNCLSKGVQEGDLEGYELFIYLSICGGP